MGSVVMLAFAAAIIGGFNSLVGCVIGGILLGVVQNFVGIFISPQAMSVTPFVVIMLVLLLRPQGLFGELALKKV
jgi:branched-chain amino acid transport system permease protein